MAGMSWVSRSVSADEKLIFPLQVACWAAPVLVLLMGLQTVARFSSNPWEVLMGVLLVGNTSLLLMVLSFVFTWLKPAKA